jgi:hypothetical protein
VAREPTQYVEDVENIHTIYKKEYVLPVDLEKQQKSGNTTGQETKANITRF